MIASRSDGSSESTAHVHLGLDVGRGGWRKLALALLAAGAGRLGADGVDGPGVRLRGQPGAQPAPRRVEPAGALPQVDEHCLADVLGEHTVVAHAAGDGPHGAGVAAVDLGEGGLVALHDGGDEVVVGAVAVDAAAGGAGAGAASGRDPGKGGGVTGRR
jgi:hypothetical protein